MGLKGDLQEVAAAWPKYSWRLRAFLVLSIVLASSSVATLSDTVFRWKGFIKDALSFYQEFIADQLLRLITVVLPNIQVPPGVPHLLILSALYLGANLRVAAFSVPNSRSRSIASRATGSYIGAAIGSLIVMQFLEQSLSAKGSLGLFVGSAFAVSVWYFRIGGAAKILWFVHLTAPFVIVGLLAAVNNGLVRDH